MISLSVFLRRLEPFLVHTHLQAGCDTCPGRIELLCQQTHLTADRMYIGGPEAKPLLASAQAQAGTIVLICGVEADARWDGLLPGCAVALFTCSLPLLYNALSQAQAEVEGWQCAYRELTQAGGGLHDIMMLTAQLAGAPALLLDKSGQVVASGGMEHSTFLAGQVAATGTLPQRTAQQLFPSGTGAVWGHYAPQGTGLMLYGWHMGQQDSHVGMLLIEGRGGWDKFDIRALCGCAVTCLEGRLFSRDLERLGSSSKTFQRCWEEIMSRNLTGTVEIREALGRMPHPVEQFVRVMVVTFSSGGAGVPYNYLLARLRELFPETNMAVYNRDIVILPTYENRTFREPLLDNQPLADLLARYDGFAAISNGTRNLMALRSLFLLAKRTALLAQTLRKNQNERIFFHEDYSMYCVIDLCVQRYLEIEGNDDVLYLIHPAVIHLTRYDRKNNNNLREVLYYYLLNDRNVVKTAAATYMHRNTVINKVNKIMELLDVDLEDAHLRQRIAFSCQVIRYYGKVMKREIQI